MNSYNTPFPTFSPFAISAWSVIVLIEIIGLWKIFIKAGKPGWASIIPIYNIIVLLEIIGKPLWWFYYY